MKKISKLDIISLSVGSIIGWGAFILPGDLFLSKIGLLNSVIGLFIGMLIIVIIERNYSYLIRKLPISGGEYIFTRKILGETNSFICGWFLSLAYICIVPLNATAVALIFRILTKEKYIYKYLYSIEGYPIYLSDVILTSFFIISLGILNIVGIKIASSFQKLMVVLLVGIVLFFLFGMIIQEGVYSNNLKEYVFNQKINTGNILKIVAISPWAYVGFDCVTQILEELDFGYRKVSIVSLISLVIGFLLYVIILLITAYGISYQEIQNMNIKWATGEAIQIRFGLLGVWALGVALLSAVTCGVNGFYINSSRLVNKMAKEGDLPEIFSRVNKKGIPRNAILLVMFLSLLTPWIGRKVLVWIVDMSSLGIAIGYFYVSFCVLKNLYSEKSKISFIGMVGFICSILFILLLILPILENSLTLESIKILIVWIVLGSLYKLFKLWERLKI